MTATVQIRRGTAYEWEARNPVLKEGELGYESGTKKYKIGDGFRRWLELPYFIDEQATKTYVDARVAELAPTVAGVSQQDLLDHINAEEPHTAYDDGVPFDLIYANAKV